MRVDNNEESLRYGNQMTVKISTLTALLMLRHKGGENMDDFLVHYQKSESDASDKDKTTGLFKALMLCTPRSLEGMLTNEPEFVKSALTDILEQTRGVDLGALFSEETFSVIDERKLFNLRALLQIIARQGKDQSIKALAVRLLLRLGLMFSSALDCLLAADLQEELKIDISWELKPLLGRSEAYRKWKPPTSCS